MDSTPLLKAITKTLSIGIALTLLAAMTLSISSCGKKKEGAWVKHQKQKWAK